MLPHIDNDIDDVVIQTIDEDNQLSISVTINPDQAADDSYIINSSEINIIDPDILFNSVDLSASLEVEGFTTSFTDTDGDLIVDNFIVVFSSSFKI